MRERRLMTVTVGDLSDVVEGEVEVIKITQAVQVLDLGNQVVLQIKNLKLRTKPREGLVDPLDVLLVE
jgi:hypothetical protein